jgi:hypothetical protein
MPMPIVLPKGLAKTFARWFTQAQSDLQDVSLGKNRDSKESTIYR